MIITKFESIKKKISKTCICLECHKKFKRSITFSQTLSPFNKTKDGQLKNKTQIIIELNVKAANWKPEIKNCEDHS